jgi:hypothetical protein
LPSVLARASLLALAIDSNELIDIGQVQLVTCLRKHTAFVYEILARCLSAVCIDENASSGTRDSASLELEANE